ncbi:hypothetical protein ABTY98_37085 [Streptomyces sp. NPDC096040]|uniref:hypothetical protein n=1 Tax=Streptomyces sp. NPDC096040 TaxID=3155541 RepID=UPI00332B05CF
MANPDIQELNQRASQLRSLADHIDSLLDAAKKHSSVGMKTWSGPNANDVRGKLKSWQRTCGTVAQSLRDEANQCAKGAKDLQNQKK